MPETNDTGDSEFVKFQNWYKDADSHSYEWRQQAREDFAFVAGDQWSAEDAAFLKEQNRPVVTFNRIDPVIDSVAGLEVNNRQDVAFFPRHEGDAATDELLTGAAKWCRDECNTEDEESDAFRDELICGMGWCLTGDALVKLPETHFTTSRAYTGPVVDIDLENGKKLTGTANHPVLTNAGWKRLCDLQEGDYLMTSAFLERVQGFPVKQFDKVETRLEDEINAFRAGRKGRRFATSPDDFYSDGRGSDVHVVYADSLLWRKFDNAVVMKKLKEQLLIGRNLISSVRVALLSSGLMEGASRSTECHASVGGGHAPRFHLSSMNEITQTVSGYPKPSANGFAARIAKLGGYIVGRHFFDKVHSHDVRDRVARSPATATPPKLVSGCSNAVSDDATRYSNLIGNFRDWKPILEVEAKKLSGGNVVSSIYVTRVKSRIIRFAKELIVHDVGTSVGMFIAGDVVTSNTESFVDYTEDLEGMFMLNRTDPLRMWWDPSATKKNLVDSRFIFYVDDIPMDIAEEMFPDVDTEDLHASWAMDTQSIDTPHDAQEAPYYRKDQSALTDKTRVLARIVEVQWWEHEKVRVIVDPITQQRTTLTFAEYDKLSERLEEFGIALDKGVTQKRKKYFKAWLGNRVLKKIDGPEEGGFTRKAMTGKRDRNKGTWYGLVRAMRDPQRWANKWLSQVQHIINTNAKGGIMAEKDAFDNPQQAMDEWASADAVTIVAPGAIQKGKIKEKPQTQYPQGLESLMQFAVGSIRDVSGVNLELLGQADRSQAGVLEHQRKQAALTILASLFDSLRRYRKEQGRLLLFYITKYLSDGRLIRIGGQSEARYVPLIRQPDTIKYDVIVDDTPSSVNLKEQAWAALQQMMPILSRIQIPLPVWLSVLKYSPLPASLTAEISQALQQAAQQPKPPDPKVQAAQIDLQAKQMDLQSKQMDMQMQQSEADDTRMRAQVDMAETMANLQNTQVERQETLGRIVKDKSSAVLNLAKAAKEGHDARLDRHNANLDTIGTILDAITTMNPPGAQNAG